MDDFEVFYRAEYSRVLSGCVALGGEVHLARDATDEAFARAWQRWPAVKAMAAPGGWVQAVALNYLRRGFRRRRAERLLAPPRRSATTAVELPDAEVWEAVRLLPPRQQTAIALRYLHDLAEADIAAAMGISRGAVSACLAAARARLRSVLEAAENEEARHA